MVLDLAAISSPQSSTLVRGPLPTASAAPSLPFRTQSLLGTLPMGTRYPEPSFADFFPPLTSSLEEFYSSLNSFSVTESKRGKTFS